MGADCLKSEYRLDLRRTEDERCQRVSKHMTTGPNG
jgi:hypothetical protein